MPFCLPQIPHGLAWNRTLGLVGEKPPTSRVCDGVSCPTGDRNSGPTQIRGLIIFCVIQNGMICFRVRNVAGLYKHGNMENMLA